MFVLIIINFNQECMKYVITYLHQKSLSTREQHTLGGNYLAIYQVHYTPYDLLYHVECDTTFAFVRTV